MDDTLRVEPTAAPVRAQVLEKLRRAIVTGRFQPGDRLIERELCELTGVSRTSVREALRQLESEGFVETIPNRGLTVKRVDLQDARDVYELRGCVEGLAARLFAERASDQEVEELAAALDDFGSAIGTKDVDDLLVLKDRFYELLLDGCRNRLVKRTLVGLHARVMALRATTLHAANRPALAHTELLDVVGAIKARNPDLAEEACRHHVVNASKVALRALSTTPPRPRQ